MDYQNVTFHSAATVAADGETINIGGSKHLTVEIYGTSTSRTINFYGIGPSGTPVALIGVNMSSLATAISTTGNAEIWQFDVTGLVSVMMDLVAVAGGNQNVIGRLVA